MRPQCECERPRQPVTPEEAALWDAYTEDRSIENRNAIATTYAPLVGKIAESISTTYSFNSRDDLVSLGHIGLLDAIERYDPKRGVRFPSYAWKRIAGQILDAFAFESGRSREAYRAVRSLNAAVFKLSGTLKRDPTDEELAEHLDLSLGRVRELRWGAIEFNSVEPGSHIITSTTGSSGADEWLSVSEIAERIASVIERMDSRSQFVLSVYRGNTTLARMAELAGASEARVSVVHTAALKELRTKLLTGPLPYP